MRFFDLCRGPVLAITKVDLHRACVAGDVTADWPKLFLLSRTLLRTTVRDGVWATLTRNCVGAV